MREEISHQPETAGHHVSETGRAAATSDSESDIGDSMKLRNGESGHCPSAGLSRSDSESPDTESEVSENDSIIKHHNEESGHCSSAGLSGSDSESPDTESEVSENDSIIKHHNGESGHCPVMSDTNRLPEKGNIVPQETTRHRFSDAGYQKVIQNDNHSNNKYFSTVKITPEFEYQYLQKYTPKSEFIIIDENSSTERNKSQAPVSLQHLIEGINVPADPSNMSDFNPPAWLDMEKFKLGRSFAIKYFFGLAYAEMLSLMILFSFKGGLDPLIFTNKSSSPFTAFQRYLSTVVRVRSWYREDVWDPKSPAGRNMSAVRTLHRSVKERMNSQDPEQVARQIKLNPDEICCPFLSNIHEDCINGVPAPLAGQCPYKSVSNNLYVNQLDMSITQFGFVGLMVLFPKKFGAYNATEKELDGFVHLWAGLGYLLGIEDRFNFCIGGLHECRRMSYDLMNYWAKPNLRDATPEWEHMSRCVVEGISYYVPENSFEASVNYLFWVLSIPISRLTVVIPWWRRILFHVHRFTFCVLVRLPGQRAFHNWLLHRRIDRATRAPASWLERVKARAHRFVQRHSAATDSPLLVLSN